VAQRPASARRRIPLDHSKHEWQDKDLALDDGSPDTDYLSQDVGPWVRRRAPIACALVADDEQSHAGLPQSNQKYFQWGCGASWTAYQPAPTLSWSGVRARRYVS
jgi:hypothetical protein